MKSLARAFALLAATSALAGGAAADEGAISQGPGTQQKLGPAVLGTVIRI